MDFRFTAHDPQSGDFLHRLPRPEKVQIGDTFGTRGTLELTYSAKALNAKPMPTFVEIRQQVTFDSGSNWSDIGPNYLRLSGSHEDTDQAGMRTVKFVSREWLLGKARVGNGDLPLIDNKRPFYQSSPGTILRTLILEAKDRGAAQGIEIGGFTGARDSSGNAWGKVATIYYSPGLPILSVLENLVEQGMCDYRMEGNTLHLFEPETTMGQDHATGTNPVRVHGAVTEAPISYTLEELTTSALLIGEDGFKLEVDNPSAPDDYGRLEVTIEQGGVNQEGTARIMVDEALNRGSREIREITRTQKAEGLKHLPYRDYRVGDFVQVRDQGGWERYRVREIQAVRDGDGWTVHTVINDRLQELLLKLAKRTSGIVNGSTGSGGDGTQPAPPAKPGIEPAAPEGLVIDQQVYLDRQGVARGAVTAGWGAVTQSTKGEAIEIGGYELWWRENETLAVWRRASSVVDSLTVTHSPVVLSDAFGNAMEYQWRVRAVAEASARPGPWSDSITLTMTQDTEPPNMPSVPEVTTEFRIVTVKVDGLDEFGESMPVDFNHNRIYFATSANMADAVQVGTLSEMGSWNSETMAPDVPVYVAVSAVDNVGNESPMTASQVVTPKNLIDDDSIRDAIEAAKKNAIDEAVTTAGGRVVHNKTTPPVNSSSDKQLDVWQQWDTLDADGTLVAVWVHDGTSWAPGDLDEDYVARINIGEGTFGLMHGSRLEAGSVAASTIAVGDFSNLATIDPVRGINVTRPNGWRTITVGDYTMPDPEAADYLMFKDRTDSVPFNAGESLRISFKAKTTMPCVAQFRLWAYPADTETGGGSGSEQVTTAYITFTEVEQQYSVTVEIPEDFGEGKTLRSWIIGLVPTSTTTVRGLMVREASVYRMTGATLIQDGAITTSKVAANAITFDELAGGAIDGKLITGARIRTSASGARVELNSEGLKAYRSNGAVVLNTDTSDGSIDMTGRLSQTIGDRTITVGGDYGGGPGIIWSDSNIYVYPPGVRYGNDPGNTSVMTTLVQGPGTNSGNSYLDLVERGDGFDLRAWKGTGSSRTDWRVDAEVGGMFRVGSSMQGAPSVYMKRGATGTGYLRARYEHPSLPGGNSTLSLEHAEIYLSASDSKGDLVSRLWGDADSTELNAGTRNLHLKGNDSYLDANGGDLYVRRRNSAGTETYPYMLLDSTGIHLTPKSRRSTFLHGTIDNKLSDPVLTLVVGNNGEVGVYGSTARIKEQIEAVDSTTYEDNLLSVPVSSWIAKRDIARSQELAEFRAENPMCPTPERLAGAPDVPQRNMGMIAEDMHEAGMTNLVGYDAYGRPDTIIRESVGMMLIPIIRRLRDRVDALETKLGETA